ncbi:MAG: ABC transporter related [Thermotogales bacterium 46_20]|nr:MAG: ABC transporter related [Thermotogales bacterium 46_20]
MDDLALVMTGISKTYEVNNVRALKNAVFKVKRNTVHALVGENGAGKTTLMKILCGLERADSGRIVLDGKEETIRSARDAFALGVGMVHQHFRLIEDFSVAENVVLGAEPCKRLGVVDRDLSRKQVEELARRSGLRINPSEKVSRLSIGQRQKVEILRVLNRGADIVILDEPTSVLTEQEIADLFQAIRRLKENGKTVVFISHKLQEVMAISDEITILREGITIDSGATSSFDAERISYLMVGETVDLRTERPQTVKDELALQVEEVRIHDRGGLAEVVKGVSFDVKKGEIVGIAGVAGNGQLQLVEGLTGLRKLSSGRVLINGKDVSKESTRQRREAGLAYIPEDRIALGTSASASITDNIIVDRYFKSDFSKAGWIRYSFAMTHCRELIHRFDIRSPSVLFPVGLLSGGNIQKVILAREFTSDPSILVVCEPTWGLDVRSIRFVYDRINEMKTKGAGVLLVSSNLDEILTLADRILVMCGGRVVASLANDRALARREIGEYMMGIACQPEFEEVEMSNRHA